jgi:glycerophosphoryl diester phosphodiesterase
MRTARRVLGAVAVAVVVPLTLAAPSGAQPADPGAASDETRADGLLVLGHRGAPGYRPEHTLASYELAARMGADYVECDAVSTADHVLVCRHENDISGTTDVADHPEFAGRRTTKTVDGVQLTGWFTEDFTLAELKTLRAVERLPDIRQENTLYDRVFAVPTVDEYLALREHLSQVLHRQVGAYIETKHPTYFDSVGLSLEEPLLADLREAHLDRPGAPVFLESFETANLRELDEDGVHAPLVQLLAASGAPADLVAAGDPRTYADLSSATGLAGIAGYADAVGPDKAQVIPLRPDGTLGEPTSFVADAHAAGLLVHPYTFRDENTFLPADLRKGEDPADFGDALTEQRRFWETGIDGMFADQPDTAVLSRDLHEDDVNADEAG